MRRFAKIVDELPSTLKSNTWYLVLSGGTFILYMTTKTEPILAIPLALSSDKIYSFNVEIHGTNVTSVTHPLLVGRDVTFIVFAGTSNNVDFIKTSPDTLELTNDLSLNEGDVLTINLS